MSDDVPNDSSRDAVGLRGSSASGGPSSVGSEAAGERATTTAAAAVAARPATLRFEHYEVLRREDGTAWELGRGAMGFTYKALDTRLHCPVALKMVNADLLARSPTVRERFLREARAAARLRHPNIASVFHLGETAAGQAFYAMEFIEGETLDARVRRGGPLPVNLVVELGMEVARALIAAGQQGLIHRDLKPANLMLVAGAEALTRAPGSDPGSGSRGEAGGALVKVIDFGLAKAAADAGPLTVAGDFLGTPQFASPEQFDDCEHDADARSDIYSLGVTLWFALTGKLPFPGKSLTEVRHRQLSQPLPAAQLSVAQVPAPVADLLASMLASDPADRPQTPHALLDALRRCRVGLAAPLPPAPPTVIPGAVARSRRWAVPVALVTLAAVLGGGAFLFFKANTPAPVDEAPDKSIAVLPFENLSADKENAFFADGVQDEILTDLAKVADLKVISRSSVMQYRSGTARNLREIGQQLGVTHLLEGSVQRAGNKVRVNAQLINARTDAHLWAEKYDRPLDDVFAIQSEIAQAIANQLQAQISPREKAALHVPATTDLPAYDLFLRARSLYAESSVTSVHEKLPQAARLLDAAVARDPKFLTAWCLLARVHGDLYFGGDDHTPARLELAGAAVQAAVLLQPDAGETHLALADYHYHGFRDYDRARAELDLARRTLPNSAEIPEYAGYIDRRQNRWDAALQNLRRALELDPRNFFTLQQMALTLNVMHHYAEVRRTYEKALAIVPNDPGVRIYRAYLDIDANADVTLFQATRAKLVAEDPRVAPDVDDPNFSLCERTPAAAARILESYPAKGAANMGAHYPHAYWEGLVARWQGDAPRARAAFTAARAEVAKTLAEQPDLAPALSLQGLIDAGLGRKEEAIAEGRRACELLPITKDALAGGVIAVNLAQILAWTGEKQAAIEQIDAVRKPPSLLSYGLLKLHPRWDDLRGDPRFEALVASQVAPK